jgi:glutaredoxin
MRIILLLFAGLVFSSIADAEIYRWTDENGQVTFSDKPSPAHPAENVKLRIKTYERVTFDRAVKDVGEEVVMYSAAWCGVCREARRYFEENGIEFTEYDIEKSKKAEAQYRKLGAAGVPVILVGERRMNGFSIQGFEALYQ